MPRIRQIHLGFGKGCFLIVFRKSQDVFQLLSGHDSYFECIPTGHKLERLLQPLQRHLVSD